MYAKKIQRHLNKWKALGKKYGVQALPEWREKRGYAVWVARQVFPRKKRR